MRTLTRILCVFTALTGMLMKSKAVFEGTVGGNVVIRCPYPDDYKYTPKYFCRHPCKSADVLIKGEKTDNLISSGRYSLTDNVSGRSFTVTINNLRLKDSGVYYCGIDKWFRDKLNKVHLTVHPAAPVVRSSYVNTETPIIWTTPLTSTENSSSYKLLTVQSSDLPPSVTPASSFGVIVVCLCVLSFLGFWILVGFVSFYSKRLNGESRYALKLHATENPDSPDLTTVEYVCYTSEEMMEVYNWVDPLKEDSSSLIYSAVHYCDQLIQEQSHSGT